MCAYMIACMCAYKCVQLHVCHPGVQARQPAAALPHKRSPLAQARHVCMCARPLQQQQQQQPRTQPQVASSSGPCSGAAALRPTPAPAAPALWQDFGVRPPRLRFGWTLLGSAQGEGEGGQSGRSPLSSGRQQRQRSLCMQASRAPCGWTGRGAVLPPCGWRPRSPTCSLPRTWPPSRKSSTRVVQMPPMSTSCLYTQRHRPWNISVAITPSAKAGSRDLGGTARASRQVGRQASRQAGWRVCCVRRIKGG